MNIRDSINHHDELINKILNHDELINNISNHDMIGSSVPVQIYSDPTMADRQYEVIMKHINDFENQLDDEHEVALKLTSFGQNILLNVTDIGYSNPSLIHYYGYVNGNYSELIQHISQINFLLTSVTKDDPNRKTRRIGFYPNDEDENSCEADIDN